MPLVRAGVDLTCVELSGPMLQRLADKLRREAIDRVLADRQPRAVEVVMHAPVETTYLVRIEPWPAGFGLR